MLPFAGTVRTAGPLRVVNGFYPKRASLGRAGLGGWEIDVVRDIKSEDLAKLQDGLAQAQQSANEAFDLLNQFEQEFDAVQAQKRQVQAVPADLVEIVSPSIHASDDLLRRMARHMAAIDLIFFELVEAFTSMAHSLGQAGFTAEATRIRLARNTLANWRTEAERRLYPRIDAALDDREAMDKDFLARLGSRGLRHIRDNDKPEYWAALDEAVATATGLEAASLSGSGDFRLGAAFITPAIAKIVVTIAIVGGALAALAMFLSRQDSAKEATNKAFGLIDDIRQKDQVRQQQVATGQKSQATADAERLADAAAAATTARAAADLAKAMTPTQTIESTLQSIFFWGILPVAGGLILLKVLKII